MESTGDILEAGMRVRCRLLRVLPIAVVVLIAAGWRLMGIAQPQIWHDEACTMWYMRATWAELLLRLPLSDSHSPLSFALFKVWALIAPSERGLRVQSVAFGVAAVALIIAWVHMIDVRAAWVAGLVAAVSPMLVHYSQELRMYSLMILCCAGGFYCAERSVQRGWRVRYACYMAFCAMVAGNLHAVGLAVFPMLASYWVMRHRGLGLSPRAAVGVTAGWLVCVLPMVWLSVHWGRLCDPAGWWIPPVGASSHEFVATPFLGLDLVDRWERQSDATNRMWWAFGAERVLVIVPVLSLGLALLRKRTRAAAAAMLAASFVYLAILVVGSGLVIPVLIARTALPAAIPLIAAVALGLGGGERRWTSVIAAALGLTWIVMLGVLWAWTVYRGPERRAADHAACGFIRRSVGPADVIVCAPYWVEYSVAYHLRDAIRGEQLIGSSRPVFTGRPVELRLGCRIDDAGWLDRLTQALVPTAGEVGREPQRRDMCVWLVEYGLFGSFTSNGTLYTAEIGRRGFQVVQGRVFGNWHPLVVTQFCRAGGAVPANRSSSQCSADRLTAGR